MKKLLVIGGSGFFGKSILESYASGSLRRHGIASIAIVARSASALGGSGFLRNAKGVELVDSDVRKLNTLLDSDIVIHAASSSDARRYREDPRRERSIIVDGTARTLELVSKADRPVRLVYVSSGAVYGPQPPHLEKLGEDAPVASEPDAAKRAYADAKRCAESLVRSSSVGHTMQCAIARCFAFVGPALPFDRHFAIGNFIGDALQGGPIKVLSAGRVVRSYMFADDLVDWLFAISESCSSSCPIYNVGAEEDVCIRELARIIGGIVGVDVTAPSLDASVAVQRYVPNTERARAELGLTLRFSLRHAIKETMRRHVTAGKRERTFAIPT